MSSQPTPRTPSETREAFEALWRAEPNHIPACREANARVETERAAYLERWPRHCTFCDGWGAYMAPDGLSTACPRCSEAGKCGRCGGELGVNVLEIAGCPSCKWSPDDLNNCAGIPPLVTPVECEACWSVLLDVFAPRAT